MLGIACYMNANNSVDNVFNSIKIPACLDVCGIR